MEKWKIEHQKLYDEDGNPKPLFHKITDPRATESKGDPRFPVTRVTRGAHEFVRALEDACVELGQASTWDEVDAAFEAVSLAREALYKHIETLERRDKQDRDTTLRF